MAKRIERSADGMRGKRTVNDVRSRRMMPDVAAIKSAKAGAKIDRVGMTDIDVPIVLRIDGHLFKSSARAAAFISLDDPTTKGIHMSRLFSRLQELGEEPITSERLEKIVKSFQESHKEMSHSSELSLCFDLNLKRKSLISGMTGWRNYPVSCTVTFENKKISWKLCFEVVYSSTCPCSAALSRQLIQEKFRGDFSKKKLDLDEITDWLSKEDSLCATPHSQRSFAKIHIDLSQTPKNLTGTFIDFIEETEKTLGTPVQSFVKRSDEQEFARLNAENLMFCEDAARRIHEILQNNPNVASFNIDVEHQESLHPHNAVAKVWSK